MGDEQNEADELYAIEEKLRLIYGEKAYKRITENEWWMYDYCQRRKKLEKQIERHRKTIIKPLLFPSIFADQKTVVKKNRQNGQRSRWQGEIVNILLKIKNSFLPTKQILIGL